MEDKQTTPKGAEIPVPRKVEWEAVLDKAAKPKAEGKRSTSGSPKKK